MDLRIVEQNKRERHDVLNRLFAPEVTGARQAVEIERARLAGESTARNAPTDRRPTLRQMMSEQRFGPWPALPEAPPVPSAAEERARLVALWEAGRALLATEQRKLAALDAQIQALDAGRR